MLKELDSDTQFTERTLRKWVNEGRISSVSIENKRLINFNLLLDILRGYNTYDRTLSVKGG